jgi:ComF family protein
MELHRTEHIANTSGQLIEVSYIGVARHEGSMRKAILDLKYHGQRHVARQLAGIVVDALRELSIPMHDMVVTWAPTTRRRMQKRSYDQSELIARHVGAFAHLPVRRLLRRIDNRHQTGQSRFERLQGVAYVGRSIGPRPVVLVDDVTTTGATFAAAARELVRCGAIKVICVAPSRTLEKNFRTACAGVN